MPIGILCNVPTQTRLGTIIYSIIQTQDVFSIRFQPEYCECDIDIYEFENYHDICKQVVERLKELKFNKQIKQNIIGNLDRNSKQIDENIHYFEIPHFCSIGG